MTRESQPSDVLTEHGRGMIQCVSDLANALTTVYPDEMQWVIDHWGTSATELLSHWPTDASGDVRPVACHSHNDEWRAVPLYSAVQAGCTSVEADVFIRDSELLVGHSVSALTPERTLRSLYLDPLLALVENQNPLENYHNHADQLNGIFDTDPKQTLVFMIDFKKDGREIWPVLDDQLSVLRQRGFLTYFNGTDIVERPITVVASGDAPFDLVIANATYRDIFYDAPLAQLADFSSQWKNPVRVPEAEKSANNEFAYDSRIPGMRSPRLEADRATASADEFEESRNRLNMAGKSVYDARNSYYASVSFTKSIGYVWGSRVSQQQLQLIRAQIRGAHQLGLKVRYWGLPYWPTGLRNHVWHILIREGVDVLSVDDLMGAAKRDWRKCKGWFC